MDEIDAEIESVVACCRKLLQIYEDAQKAMSDSAPPAIFYDYMDQMSAAGQQLAECRTRIDAFAVESGVNLTRHPGFAEWQELMARILEENLRIKCKVEASMAVAKDELDRMRTGKQALGGYHSKGSVRGQNAGARIDCGA